MDQGIWYLGGLFLLTFLSEDAAVIAGGIAASEKTGAWLPVFLTIFLGVWAGDIGIYLLARFFGRPLVDRLWGAKRRMEKGVERGEEWFHRYGFVALLLCRVVPGMRLPTYISAGLLKMPSSSFTFLTGIFALGWILLIFWVVELLGKAAPGFLQQIRSHLWWTALAVMLCVGILKLLEWAFKCFSRTGRPWLWLQWEFWPAWIFYIPVALNYLRLALWYRGLILPTCANPGMPSGGLIGESKYVTLSELQASSPEFVATTFLLEGGTERMSELEKILKAGELSYPIVLKPDVGQRGDGFKVIRSPDAAQAYLSEVSNPIVVQRYIPGPHEAGIFYYRLPGESSGHILAITEKLFPIVTGDGRSTLEELILGDQRASIIAETYQHRFEKERSRIFPVGEHVRLVEAGNHAQGCIFKDGMHLWSDQLETCIDTISRRINGFFIGRYDLRYSDPELLRTGQSFQILELNGASAEATSAYDASKSLIQSYALLFKQWDLVFQIGFRNRSLGHKPESLVKILSEWSDYRQNSRNYPTAD
jgi:membrane protein DedA with SNARE-associated domain